MRLTIRTVEGPSRPYAIQNERTANHDHDAPAAALNHIIAFEVAQNALTLHLLPAGKQEVIANTPAAVRRILQRETKRNQKTGLGPMLVVCEATGGLWTPRP